MLIDRKAAGRGFVRDGRLQLTRSNSREGSKGSKVLHFGKLGVLGKDMGILRMIKKKEKMVKLITIQHSSGKNEQKKEQGQERSCL